MLEREKKELDRRIYQTKLEIIKTSDFEKKERLKELIKTELNKYEKKVERQKAKEKKENVCYLFFFLPYAY